MVEPFTEGYNRIVYKSEGFKIGLVVTALFWNPLNEKSGPHVFKELEEGIYYFDFNFDREGTWIAIIFENGEKKISQAYKVKRFESNIGLVVHKKRR